MVEYAPYALKYGVRVAPKESQKAPKLPKTTKGKVLPIIHCSLVSSSHTRG